MLSKSNERLYLYLFLLPCLIYIIVWRILPVFYTFVLSLWNYNLLEGSKGFAGISNYRDVIISEQFHNSLKITSLFTIAAVAVQICLGLGLAMLIEQIRYGKNFARSSLLIPLFLPTVAVGTVWYIMFSKIVGPIDYFIESMGFTPPDWLTTPFYAFVSILIADTWQWTPFTFILLLAGLQNVNVELYEAARVDGATRFQIFFRITLPLISGTILTTVILRSMDAFRVFGKVYIMTAGGPGRRTEVLSMLIVKSAFEWFEIDFAAALVFLLLIFLGLVYYFSIRTLPWFRIR